jgi:hypothetical protein
MSEIPAAAAAAPVTSLSMREILAKHLSVIKSKDFEANLPMELRQYPTGLQLPGNTAFQQVVLGQTMHIQKQLLEKQASNAKSVCLF